MSAISDSTVILAYQSIVAVYCTKRCCECQGKERDVTRDRRPNTDHVTTTHVDLA